jgi:arylsulfatase A-like enzyme
MPTLNSAETVVEAPPQTKHKRYLQFPMLIAIPLWFGIFAGMLEGAFLLLFQRINWQRWGPMTHVSKEIVWISPIVDAIFFMVIALIVGVCEWALRRIPTCRVLVFCLSLLTVYDWVALSERLYNRASFLLALGVAVAFTRWFQRHRQRVLTFWRTNCPWLLAAWLLLFASMKGGEWLNERRQLAELPAARAGAPNVLVIVTDTLRADHLSTYGYSRATTPNIDRLASQGVLFENAISVCSWTLPSHASLLTGRYPADHGMGNAQPMPWFGWGEKSLRGYRTLGEALEQNGYRTGAFSANQSYFTSNVGLGRGFIHFEDYFQSAKDMFLRTFYGRAFEANYLRRSGQSKVTRAIRFLGLTGLLDNRKHASEVNREALAWLDRGPRPFLAFLNYIEVHDQAPPRDFKRLWGLDTEIGDLMKQLQQRRLLKNTVVIFTSDHGESLGQHAMSFHGIALYREQIRVPLLIWYPGKVPAGIRVTLPVSNAAIAATVMDLVETEQGSFPGAGLDEFWTKFKPSWPSPISQLAKNEIVIDPDRQARNIEPTAMDGDMTSMFTPQWHFIVHQTLGEQLYDWRQDPGEVRNLLNTPQGQAAVQALRNEMQQRTVP